MSYDVIAWKSGQIQMEVVAPVARSGYDHARQQHRPKTPAAWRPGRITLSRRTLAYQPSGVAAGTQPVTIDLCDIRSVEIGGGRLARVVSFRTDRRVMHLRTTGGHAFAKRVALACESAESRRVSHQRRTSVEDDGTS